MSRTIGKEALARMVADFMQRLGGAFHRAQGGLPQVMRQALERGSLAPRHVQVINILAFEEQMSVTAIAERLGVGLPAASQLVGELAREEWVERREDATDRRRTLVVLAPEHRRDVEAYCRSRAAPLLRATKRLSGVERAAFLEGLRMLLEEMDREALQKEEKG